MPEIFEVYDNYDADDESHLSSSQHQRVIKNDFDTLSDDGLELLIESPDSFWPIFKTLSCLGIPRALSFTFSIEMILVLWLLESLDSDDVELTAASWSILLINAVVTMGLSPLYALNPLLNALLGEITLSDDEAQTKTLRDKFSRLIKQAYIIGATLLPITLLPLFFSGALLEDWLGQDEEVAASTQEFTRYFAPVMVALNVRMVTEEVIYAFDQQVFAATAGLGNLTVGMSAGWYLAKYQGMGARGIALGCVIESYLTAMSFVARIGLHRAFKDYRFFTDWKDLHRYYKQVLDLLRIGASIFFTNLSEIILPFAGGLFASWCSLSSGATWNTVMQLFGITGFLRFALAFSVCKEVSVAIGASNFSHAKKIGLHGLITTLAYTTPPALALAAWHLLVDPDEHLEFVIPLACVGVLADVIRFHFLQYCRGIDDNLFSSILSGVILMIGAGACYLSGNVLGYDVEGIVTTFALTYGIAALMLAIRAVYCSLYKLDDSPNEQSSLNSAPANENNNERSNYSSWSPRLFQLCASSKSAASELPEPSVSDASPKLPGALV